MEQLGRWDAWRFRDRVADLIADLTADRVLTDRMWRTALHEVPRHLFVPDRAYAKAAFERGTHRVIARQQDPTDWWNALYTNCSIITQRGDGTADVADTSAPSSCSLSCPSISMRYLHLLDLQDQHRVLEIGTGTGWTAAMLAWRLGDRGVTTVEVDEGLAKTAADNLARAGRDAQVVCADGAEGHLPEAPYDRVHVTCGVRDIPVAWIAQTRPGGKVVVPWMPQPDGWGFQLVLDVVGEGTAIGRFAGGGGFMMLRSQRTASATEPQDEAARSTTRLDPELITATSGGDLLAQAALAPGIYTGSSWAQADGEWTQTVILHDVSGTSQATVSAAKGGADFDVLQYGPRRLWDEAEAAYRWWLSAGSPDRSRYGFAVSDGVQRIWLDTPAHVLG
jgi:protein-L-isoaspartate O-methyltransferase